MNTCDFLLERGGAADVAIIEGSRNWSYAQLRDAVAVLAARLQAEDLAPGAPVVVAGGNSFFWVAAYLAVLKMGLVAVPTSSDARRVSERMTWLGCRTLMADRPNLRRLAPRPEIVTISEQDITPGADGYWPDDLTGVDTDAALMFTSGSTADPKAVRVTTANLQANTESIMRVPSPAQRRPGCWSSCPSSTASAPPCCTRICGRGAPSCCATRSRSRKPPSRHVEHACTGLAGVPSTFAILLRARWTFGQRPLPGLRLIQQAGGTWQTPDRAAALPAAGRDLRHVRADRGHRSLVDLPPDRWSDKLGSIGRGIPGVELQVRGPDGSPVAVGDTGEIWARGANVSPGYYRNPAATRDKFQDGWLRTGDLGRVDEEGFIFVVDRKDDFIKSWGHRVSAQEVEEAALGMPDVVNAAVVGTPERDGRRTHRLVRGDDRRRLDSRGTATQTPRDHPGSASRAPRDPPRAPAATQRQRQGGPPQSAGGRC